MTGWRLTLLVPLLACCGAAAAQADRALDGIPALSAAMEDVAARNLDPRVFCPPGNDTYEACARHVGFWGEQHTLMLNTALTTTGNPQQLLEEEAAWVNDVQALCAHDIQCLADALQERNAVLASVRQTAGADELTDEPYSPEPGVAAPSYEDNAAEDVAAGATPSPGDVPTLETRPQPTPATSAGSASNTPLAGQSGPGITPEAQLALLILLAISVAGLTIFALAAWGKVVFYYDTPDFAWSLSPALSVMLTTLVISILRSGQHSATALDPLQWGVIGIGSLLCVTGVLIAYFNAIRYNRSLLVGLVIGTCKTLVASFMILSLFANGGRRFNEDFHKQSARGRKQRSDAKFAFAVLASLWLALVNGERVYRNKGWQYR